MASMPNPQDDRRRDEAPEPAPEEEYEPLDTATEAALGELVEKLERPLGWVPEPGDRIAFRASKWETVEPGGDPKKRCEVCSGVGPARPISVFTYPKQLKTKLIKEGISTQAEAEAVPHEERLVQPGD